MAKKKTSLNEKEIRLVEKLRQRPALLERFEAILELSESEEGPVKTADEVEALLIEEVRRLGHTTMEEWAKESESRIGREHKESHPGSYNAKKNG